MFKSVSPNGERHQPRKYSGRGIFVFSRVDSPGVVNSIRVSITYATSRNTIAARCCSCSSTKTSSRPFPLGHCSPDTARTDLSTQFVAADIRKPYRLQDMNAFHHPPDGWLPVEGFQHPARFGQSHPIVEDLLHLHHGTAEKSLFPPDHDFNAMRHGHLLFAVHPANDYPQCFSHKGSMASQRHSREDHNVIRQQSQHLSYKKAGIQPKRRCRRTFHPGLPRSIHPAFQVSFPFLETVSPCTVTFPGFPPSRGMTMWR